MEHLESVEEGTEKAKEFMDSNAGSLIDPQNEQDNAECEEEEEVEHPDFLIKDPDGLPEGQAETSLSASYKRIELYNDEKIESLTLRLHDEQRFVLDVGVNFAKNIVKSKNAKYLPPRAPLMVVQGGAGTGKSTIIDAMSQQMERIFRTPGDNPHHPYIIKCAFTGTAAANILGQTMHSAFSFNFGNEFLTLGDKSRDEKRKSLENLQVIIIDEYSMIKSDMLYQLDLRLKELKEKQNIPFGGVSIFLFGDILQLKPVRARYIFDEPQNETFNLTYLVDPLWKKFEVVLLKINHRQGEDRIYADMLNRFRTGEVTEEDAKMLESRVRPLNHPEIPNDALVISCKNAAVNAINEEKLNHIDGEEYEVEAIVKSKTRGKIKPMLDSSGAIRNTPLQQKLKLKVGAHVMLTHNIDTCDSLTNGTFGKVLAIVLDIRKSVSRVNIQFKDEISGKERRKNYMKLQQQYAPIPVTPIEKIEFQYSLSRKPTKASSNVSAVQFPLRLAFAATAHKIQGATIKKPNMLVIDLRTVMEAAQAYVMLSRVQALCQLIILVSSAVQKIYASKDAIHELNQMTFKAVNARSLQNVAVSCNIRSISRNFNGFRTTPNILNSDILCLQETWNHSNQNSLFDIEHFEKHVNGFGRGTGIITYFRSNYSFEDDVSDEKFQMTKVSSETLDVINVYRSKGANSEKFLDNLVSIFQPNKETLVLGDFNLCFQTETNHTIVKFLKDFGFKQLVTHPTHDDGRYIDWALIYHPEVSSNNSLEVTQLSPYFSDHDILFVHKVFISFFICSNPNLILAKKVERVLSLPTDIIESFPCVLAFIC